MFVEAEGLSMVKMIITYYTSYNGFMVLMVLMVFIHFPSTPPHYCPHLFLVLLVSIHFAFSQIYHRCTEKQTTEDLKHGLTLTLALNLLLETRRMLRR